ncbi:sensor domain-containing diguanylate cyclase [Stutzerimonas azotifigens]|uniref:sensor domain-containing diguanylate cyclase n=1 Tax=Stutzerimonas azotifigens TaxID=291995 RepID=UPI00041442D0|nr:diguanylate cyclase [Stutzerimonas azotifigens]
MQRLLSMKQSSILLLLGLLIGLGFLATTLASYHTSRSALRDNIMRNELPLTANSIYLEIQRDLVVPVQIASAMASDAFMLEWAGQGERNPGLITRYLEDIKRRYDTSTAFFVSDRSGTYYSEKGVLHRLDPNEPRTQWFYEFKASGEPWEVVVDVAQKTMFINNRVVDEDGRFLGAAGVGLTLDRLLPMIDSYQQRYDRNIYFVDAEQRLVVTGSDGGPGGAPRGAPLREIPALQELLEQAPQLTDGSYQYHNGDSSHFINVRYIPELDWHLLIDKQESGILAPIRRTLWLNLLICLGVTAVVLTLVGLIIRRYLQRIEALATRDSLTGLLNRRGFGLVAEQAMKESRRKRAGLCALVLDIDHFKKVNDTYGHAAGDELLRGFAARLTATVRRSDVVARWGGEEFVVLLKDTPQATALGIAEKLRAATEDDPFACGDALLPATTSIGVACLVRGESLAQLLKRADQALYGAKRQGRNRVQVNAPAPHPPAITSAPL